jgi:dTDP-4-dehydrorhamnose 3,5-epimerase-like enzyme
MAFDDRYHTRLDNKYGELKTIDIPAEVAAHELTIPRGVVHRTRALVKTVILMVEGATVTPTGDGASAL